jgi:phage protein D
VYSTSFKNYKSTDFEIVFPTLPGFDTKPVQVDLHQGAYKHDIMLVQFPQVSAFWFKSLNTGVPVIFRWSQGILKRSWQGYVHSVSKSVAGQRDAPFELMLIGASMPLKNRVQRTFRNKTIPEVAALIAREFNLAFSIDAHPRRFSYLAISGESYWEWLCKYAQQIGYHVYVDNATLFFKKIDNILDERSKDVAIMSMASPALPINNHLVDRTLYNFKVTNGDYIEGADETRANKVVSGVNPITSAQVTSVYSPRAVGKAVRTQPKAVIFDDYKTDLVSNDTSATKANAEGSALMAKMNLPAKVLGQGDPRLSPYSLVQITGTGEQTDGFWVVKNVKHTFGRGRSYDVEIDVLSDGFGPNAVSSFRAGNATKIGIIDVDAILASDVPTTNVSRVAATIKNKLPIIMEQAVSFEDNPVMWQATYVSREGCCN